MSDSRRRSKRDNRVQAVIDSVQNFELSESSSWSDLDALSNRTYVDQIEVDPAGVIIERGGHFQGMMNVYVLLEYGSSGDDRFETSDSFLGRFKGHFDQKQAAVIDEISVDTSPFYK